MKSGTLIINNFQGRITILRIGDNTAIAAALEYAGKHDPQISNAISTAAVELDDYSEALKTGEALRKIIENNGSKNS